MFTVNEIHQAHAKVKSGADFPTYIQELKKLGVISFETWIKDSHTLYFGKNGYSVQSTAQYPDLYIEENCTKEPFIQYLKLHQQGKTDYFAFCNNCAETGIEKWIVSLETLTCTYYDKNANEILKEEIPA